MLNTLNYLSLIFCFNLITTPLYANNVVETSPDLISMKGNKIVTAAGVRMRAEIRLDAKVLHKLNLGTVVKASQRTREKVSRGSVTGYWYYVSNRNQHGWVFGALLGDFKAGREEETHWKLVQQRSAKKPASFSDYAQLHQYIKAILPTIKTTKTHALLALEEVLALQRAADKIPYNQYDKTPYSSFLTEHKKELFYDEISGQYLISSQRYWDLSERYSQSSAGDKLTWFAAKARTGGECEGELACVFMRMSTQEGIYLKRYSDGYYAQQALKAVEEILAYMINELKTNSKSHPNTRFKEIEAEQKIILSAIQEGKSYTRRRENVIKQLKQLSGLMKRR
ncbi:MAG: SH3 domain-containing protein [Cocleimonas sp.]|nr:SH3 domain-containing protein [Cocleimonas sp.]